MIKARLQGETGDLLMFGITKENIDRMLDSKPIVIDGAELLMPGFQIVIFANETIEGLKEDLRVAGIQVP